MKKIILLALMLLNFTLIYGAGEEVEGIWVTPGGDLVKMYQEGNEFTGEIIKLVEPIYPKGHALAGKEKIDTENPDKSKQTRKVTGMKFLWGFKYDDKGKYKDGKIYDPGTGKTYYCKMELKGDTLKLRGSLDKMGIAGSTQEWKRSK